MDKQMFSGKTGSGISLCLKNSISLTIQSVLVKIWLIFSFMYHQAELLTHSNIASPSISLQERMQKGWIWDDFSAQFLDPEGMIQLVEFFFSS